MISSSHGYGGYQHTLPSKLFLTSKVYSVCEDDLNASSSGHVESCEDQSIEA